MKTRKLYLYMAGAIALIVAFSSCTKDLDTIPLDPDEVTSASVYTKDLTNYTKVLAKLYAGLSVTGQEGPAGMGDISGLDEGFSQYLRLYWYAQELSTDEAIISWNDGNLRDFHDQDWTASNEFLAALYYRIYYQISVTNEFLRETTPTKLDERGVAEADKTVINTYRAEARFLRALSYYHAIDLFGSVPFVTEEDNVGSFFPEQISRDDLFTFLELELTSIENDLMDAGTNAYGRADKGAAWMLLAKLYLNAEVYIGESRYTECITYCENIIDAGYTLEPEFARLFMADNHTASGIIFPITFDGTFTRTWGGTTFIIHAAVGGTMAPGDFGIDGGWAGLRVTRSLVEKFIDPSILKSFPANGSALKSSKAYPVRYVPGDHNGWSHDDNNVIASVNSDDNYEGYFWMTDGSGFKITADNTWDENYGDNEPDGVLDQNGSNIGVSGDGYYKLYVNWATKAYTFEKTEWGIIGDATPGGWDGDTNMEYDAETGEWVIITNLSAGKLKFRANDGWDINYGDNGADGILESGGADIDVLEPAKYEVRLKLGAPDYTYTITKTISDERIMFHSDGQSIEINEIFEFTEGWAVTKFTNLTSGGVAGSHLTYTDTDFPLFRIADVYLMYAEAILRGGTGGDAGLALELVNRVISRGYAGDDGANIESEDLTLDFILDERAREFLWETHRRTDLVRFGKFSNSDYIWAWKGGVPEGKPVESKFDIYPLPASDIAANPNLEQVYY